jgi:hypothetical protein
MKTFVLTFSRTFPKTHKRSGEETYFHEKILANEDIYFASDAFSEFDIAGFEPKIHTIRSNYQLWKHRIEHIQKGEAILSLRYWSEKPYRSKQIAFCRLDKDSGIGVQQLDWTIDNSADNRPLLFDSCKIIDLDELSKNDGLSLNDFKEWFKNYDLSKSMAIIHFTEMRY